MNTPHMPFSTPEHLSPSVAGAVEVSITPVGSSTAPTVGIDPMSTPWYASEDALRRAAAGDRRALDLEIEEHRQHKERVAGIVAAQFADKVANEVQQLEIRAAARALFESGTPATAEPGDDAPTASTWLPVDLTPYLDGTHQPERPVILTRSDGEALLYRGRSHSFHGESESGKSLAAQFVTVERLEAGERVLYVDFESDAAAVLPRLLSMGASPQAIRNCLDYLRPDRGLRDAASRSALDALMSNAYGLAVIDGVTEALAVLTEAGGRPEEQISQYVALLPRRIARATGAAVVQVDHVTKSADGRGRYAYGSQHKMNTLDGAAYTVEVVEPLGLGLRGVIVLRVGKDRPGSVRPTCGAFRKLDRTQEAARITFDATTPGRTVVTVGAPLSHVGQGDDVDTTSGFRPTLLMERVSLYLEGQVDPVSGRSITDNVSGKAGAVRVAVDRLVADGFVSRVIGTRSSQLHASTRAYRQTTDPLSDKYAGGDALNPFHTVTGAPSVTASASPSKKGDAGRTQNHTLDRDPGRGGTQSGRGGTRSGIDRFDTTRDPWPDPPLHACAGDVCQVPGCDAAS